MDGSSSSSTAPESERVIDEARIIELETRIAFQDHLLASLDEVLREFTARVERLERKLALLQASIGTDQAPGPADEPPPHY